MEVESNQDLVKSIKILNITITYKFNFVWKKNRLMRLDVIETQTYKHSNKKWEL